LLYTPYLKSKNILAVPFGGQYIRFVTHLDISDEHLNALIEKLRKVEF